MQSRSTLRDYASLTKEAMGHDRPDEGKVPAVAGGAS